MPIHFKTPDLTELHPKIAVFGVGGAGGNAVNNMIAANLQGVSFVVANTDAQALIHSQAETRIQLGAAMTEGLGAGSKPEIGAAAAEESIEEIRSHLRGLHMVFITAGMGGGTGTGAAPVIAAAARAEGVLTVGVVTKPFHFEGQRRMRSAEFGIDILSEQVDTLIVIPNQNLFRVAVTNTTFSEAFALADQVLHDGISCITDVMVKEGVINLDFADVNLVMRAAGKAMMGTGESSGENRGREAAESAISNPLLDDVSLKGAKGLLVSIIGAKSDLTLYEVDEASNRVREEVAPDANIIIGTAYDESLKGTIRVSVVVTGLDEQAQEDVVNAPVRRDAASKDGESLTSRLGQVSAGQDETPQPAVAAGEGVRPPYSEPLLDQSDRYVSVVDEIYGERPDPVVPQGGYAGGADRTDCGVKMPTIDDFPPVGQALLREQQGGGAGISAGIETHKQRVGFFERLTEMATSRLSTGRRTNSVAQQPQIKIQSPVSAGAGGQGFIDPHQKGAALSPQKTSAGRLPTESEEVTDFPAFLRK